MRLIRWLLKIIRDEKPTQYTVDCLLASIRLKVEPSELVWSEDEKKFVLKAW